MDYIERRAKRLEVDYRLRALGEDDLADRLA